MPFPDSKYLLFLASSLTEINPFISTSEVVAWLSERNDAITVEVNKITFDELDQWKFTPDNYNLVHQSGKFFSIDGITVKTNFGNIPQWQQPIINQPEIGYLGFITKVINGILYFLVQAKIEPGNVNNVQLSPTLQATKSNYTQIHKGNIPHYLEYFKDRSRCKVLVDQLQSEQGARFLQKRNRNIIVLTEEEIEVKDDFLWLTLGQLKKLIQIDNLVNMDTRTVISGIPFVQDGPQTNIPQINIDQTGPDHNQYFLESALNPSKSLNSVDDIIAWFTELKCNYELSVEPVSLGKIADWEVGEKEIRHKDGHFFQVIATEVLISNREVSRWTQPLVQPSQHGLLAFIIKKINGVYHFIVQAKLECGNFDILEMAPTVQCLTGNYRETLEGSLPFLQDVLTAAPTSIIYDTIQSEEGGRFYKEQNRNMIIEMDESYNEELPINYNWMTLHQLQSFLKYNNYLNIQARSLISLISFI